MNRCILFLLLFQTFTVADKAVLSEMLYRQQIRQISRNRSSEESYSIEKMRLEESQSFSFSPHFAADTQGDLKAGATATYQWKEWILQGRYAFDEESKEDIENLIETSLLIPIRSDLKRQIQHQDTLLALTKEIALLELNRAMTFELKALFATLLSMKRIDNLLQCRQHAQARNEQLSKRIKLFSRNGLIPRMMTESFSLNKKDNSLSIQQLQIEKVILLSDIKQKFPLTDENIGNLITAIPDYLTSIREKRSLYSDSLQNRIDSLYESCATIQNRFVSSSNHTLHLGPLLRYDHTPQSVTFGVKASLQLQKKQRETYSYKPLQSSVSPGSFPVEEDLSFAKEIDDYSNSIDTLVSNLLDDMALGNTSSFYIILDLNSRQLQQQIRAIDLIAQKEQSLLQTVISIEAFGLTVKDIMQRGNR